MTPRPFASLCAGRPANDNREARIDLAHWLLAGLALVATPMFGVALALGWFR